MGIFKYLMDIVMPINGKRLSFLLPMAFVILLPVSTMLPSFQEIEDSDSQGLDLSENEAGDEDFYLDMPGVQDTEGMNPWILIIPLYYKTPANLFLNETRANIHEIISSNPGITFGAITRELGLAPGMCQHHIRVLEREGHIKSKRTGKYTRYYLIGHRTAEVSKVQEQITLVIKEQEGISQSQIAISLGISRQVVNYNIKPLVKNGSIMEIRKNGRCFYYSSDQQV
jgi:DNA-binding MarR family transcriptional regulator